MRQLASVQTVLDLSPIEGADLIELATIMGWQCVVKKGEFAVGDKALYFEIDSVPPDAAPFRFLWAPKQRFDNEGNDITPTQFDRPRNYRIRTMKLRGALSQGLLVPLSAVEDVLGNEIVGDFETRVIGAINAAAEEAGAEVEIPQAMHWFLNVRAKFPVSHESGLTMAELAARGRGIFTVDWSPSIVDMLFINATSDQDLTAVLGVTKYEPATDNSGQSGFKSGRAASNFPSIVPKTDETRVQGATAVLDELKGHPYVMTVKLDGTSATFLVDPRDDTFHACSRNFSIRRPAEGEEVDSVYWQIALQYDIEAKLRRLRRLPDFEPCAKLITEETVLFNDEVTGMWQNLGQEFVPVPYHVAIQGEIVGPGIQGNKLGLNEVKFFAFNVYDIAKGRPLSHAEAAELLDRLEIPRVPVEEIGEFFDYDLKGLLAKAEGKYEGTKNEREGLVIRALDGLYSQKLRGTMSFKCISNRFLLKGGD